MTHVCPDFHTLATADKNGFEPNASLISLSAYHHKRGEYIITGFAWIGDVDEWGITHIATDNNAPFVTFIRSASNFFGEVRPGVPRFKVVYNR